MAKAHEERPRVQGRQNRPRTLASGYPERKLIAAIVATDKSERVLAHPASIAFVPDHRPPFLEMMPFDRILWRRF